MKKVRQLAAAGVAISAVTINSAFAALPVSVTTDMTTAGTDAATLGGIVLGLVVAIAAYKHIRSAK